MVEIYKDENLRVEQNSSRGGNPSTTFTIRERGGVEIRVQYIGAQFRVEFVNADMRLGTHQSRPALALVNNSK